VSAVRTRLRALDELTDADLSAWDGLAYASEASVPFLLSGYVQAAARWLTPDDPPVVLTVERGSELLALTCLQRRAPNLFVPVPHWRAYKHLHAFQSGVLHREGEASTVADAIARLMRTGSWRERAIAWHNVAADGALWAALRDSAGLHWSQTGLSLRPVLRRLPHDPPAAARVRASVAKDLRRRLRRLQERGETSLRILEGAEADAAAAQRHLALEDAGWKGEQASSMLAADAQRTFFLEAAARLSARGHMVFVETLCDGHVVASSSNLLCGKGLSGFKTGWDPAFAAVSPGKLNEWHLLQALDARWPGLALFDSQAHEDSYMGDLLPDRQPMVSGILHAGVLHRGVMAAARPLRPLAYRRGHDD
jgi:CelD/BcsL family acetyltransferase involved in cellulose biosynthesis